MAANTSQLDGLSERLAAVAIDHMAELKSNQKPIANTDNLAEQIAKQVAKHVTAAVEEAVTKAQDSITNAIAIRTLREQILACARLMIEFYSGEEDVRSLIIMISTDGQDKCAKVVGTRRYQDHDDEYKRERLDLVWGPSARSDELALQNLHKAMEAALERAESLPDRVDGFHDLYDLMT